MIGTLLAKVDVRDIWTDHVATLRDASTGKRSWWDHGLFFVVPAVAIAFVAYVGVPFTDTTIGVMATALSVMAGLLFNLLVLLHTLQPPAKGEPFDSRVRTLRDELHANIAYAIMVSLITLLPIMFASYHGASDPRRTIAGYLVAYLALHFVLTMGMVLKRMNAMLQLRS